MSRSSRGRLLVIEGPGGVGKSTLARLATDDLRAAGHDVVFSSFPGPSESAPGLVSPLDDALPGQRMESVCADALLALQLAAHLEVIETQVLPALAAGRVVVQDRYWWSLAAYGRLSGARSSIVEALVRTELVAWQGHRPTACLLTRNRESTCMRGPSDLVAVYQRLAAHESKLYPVHILSNDGSLSELTATYLRLVRPALPKPRLAAARQLRLPSERPSQAAPEKTIVAFARLAPAQPTPVYETYWRFAAERQAIFFRRLLSQSFPWTTDPILRQYKFTNAYRASDRVSQFLIRDVIYSGELEPTDTTDVVFRILLFKLFNRIETWEHLRGDLGEPHYRTFSERAYANSLAKLRARGETIYSPAYVMPPPRAAAEGTSKHEAHLALLRTMLEDGVAGRIAAAHGLSEIYDCLHAYPMIGPFLAFQYATDLNYSPSIDHSEMAFVVPGPGALEGMRKCFATLGGLTPADVIRFVADHQEEECQRLGISFQTLWGRRLQLVDCQNLFCETAKYARVRHPDYNDGGRHRIKQRFRPQRGLPQPWYPPKWGLNERIGSMVDSASIS